MLRNYKTIGTGKGIAIKLSRHGLGDDLCAMPALSTTDVTIFTDLDTPFKRSAREVTFQNAEVYDIKNVFMNHWRKDGKIIDLTKEFAVIYDMNEWSVWETNEYGFNLRTPIQLFAHLIGAELPKSFDWHKYLNPEQTKSYVLFAPDSSGLFRRMAHQYITYLWLKLRYKDVLMFGVKESFFKKTDRFRFHEYVNWGFGHKFFRWYNKAVCKLQVKFYDALYYHLDSQKQHVKTFPELVSLIASAKAVVAGDNGIMNIAAALGAPLVPVFGMTDEMIVRQFDTDNHLVVTQRKQAGCDKPCNRKGRFYKDKCLGIFKTALCMKKVKPSHVMGALKLMGI